MGKRSFLSVQVQVFPLCAGSSFLSVQVQPAPDPLAGLIRNKRTFRGVQVQVCGVRADGALELQGGRVLPRAHDQDRARWYTQPQIPQP